MNTISGQSEKNIQGFIYARKRFAERQDCYGKRHFFGKMPVSAICEEYGTRSEIFRRWETAFFENGELLFRQISRRHG
ncbi:Uncharacterized protein dnm_036540 [Desulfonema magnum]|uniref:Transposase n=1 Tax=Desulfonema magnum TaxID=45655 RepID=A0A975BLJ0_9BACT|nr:Uncharacterized protein dnm_036540 [Desulfonema magnum]